jgi:hypothetical protein
LAILYESITKHTAVSYKGVSAQQSVVAPFKGGYSRRGMEPLKVAYGTPAKAIRDRKAGDNYL